MCYNETSPARPLSSNSSLLTLALWPGETLGFLLDFLYSGAVDLDANNAEALYLAGQAYALPRLEELAEGFLEKEVPHNSDTQLSYGGDDDKTDSRSSVLPLVG